MKLSTLSLDHLGLVAAIFDALGAKNAMYEGRRQGCCPKNEIDRLMRLIDPGDWADTEYILSAVLNPNRFNLLLSVSGSILL